MPCSLTIGGSDSSGGAGIQADLKTFLAHRVHGLSVLSGVTAQNTTGVKRAAVMDAAMVSAQIEAVAEDFEIAAAKTGLLFNAAIVEVVSDAVSRFRIPCLVVDPVLVDKHNRPIVDAAAIDRYRSLLLPKCRLATPNLREAEILSGLEITGLESVKEAGRALCAAGIRAVLIKGGRWQESPGTDVFFDGERLETLRPAAIGCAKAYGTGCALSAAIAAHLALGGELYESIEKARAFVTQSLQQAQKLGKGQPVLAFQS